MLRAFSFAFLFSLLYVSPTWALTAQDLGVRHAYVVDFDTGAVLMDHDADVKMPTASMSKVMTMYVVFDALKKGRIKLDDTLPVSEKAWRMEGSKMFVPLGKSVRVEDLIRGVIIQSGNDATVVLAEGLAGGEEAFAARMNDMAAELGMTNSHFMNASGWPDPNHYSTAKDLTILARALITNFPEYYKYYAEKEFTYNKIKQGNRNPLLYNNTGGDGIKTGHTEEAGYGLIGSGIREGRRVVFVVSGLKSMSERAQVSQKVLGWALGSFMNLSPYTNGQIVTTVPVALGTAPDVPVTVGSSLVVTVPRLGDRDLKVTAKYTEPLIAPIKKGDAVGTLSVQLGPEQPSIELPLVAATDVPSLGFFARAVAKALYTTTGKGFE
jgi:serine-type D-Ala-D-Ala carboxypeptidase (penicillin-binding protein 5/6)